MDLFDLVRHHASGGITLFDGSDDWDPGHFFTKSDAEKLAEDQWEWQKQWYDTNWGSQQYWNEQNLQYQKDVLGYQQYLNNLQMQREDTAVQRRVADLKAAGLSPTLAAGSAADTGALHAGQAPQGVAPQHEVGENPRIAVAMFKQQMLKDNLALATSVLGNIADISRTKAETELLNSQTNQINSMTPVELAIKEQLLEFNEQMNPRKIKQAVNTIDLQEKEKAIKDFDLILSQDDHAMKAYQMAKINLENDLIRVNMSVADREYILKGLAINMAEMENANYAHAMDWFDERYSGAPVGFNIPNWTNALSNSVYNIATQATKGLEDFVGRNIDQAKKAAARARELASNPDKRLHSSNPRSNFSRFKSKHGATRGF